MVTDFLKQMVSEIETISDETIYDFGLSLPVVEKEEKIIGVLSEEGKRIYSLLILKENEIDEEDLSILEEGEDFSSGEEDNPEKDYRRIIKLEDEIKILEDILFMEVQEIVRFFFEGGPISSEDFSFAFREEWQIVEIKLNKVSVNILFNSN